MVDLLFLHRAVEVVDAEPQRRLRHLHASRDPERLHVRDVVAHQARHRVHAQAVGRAGRRQLPHLVVVGMKGQGDERLEAAGLVLQRARAQHVIDPFFRRLDVSVQHRHVRPHAETMRRAMNLEVPIGSAFVVGDLAADTLGEDFRAAPRQRIEPGRPQLPQHLLVGPPVEIREERDLDGGETFQMDVGPDAFEAAQQLRVVVERQIRMQPVDDVDFRERLMATLPQFVPSLLERHRVRAGVAGLQPRERAEETTGDADVCRLEPDVEVVEGARAVAFLALAVCEPADG